MPRVIHFGTDGWRATIAEDYTFDNVRLCAAGSAEYFLSAGKAERGIVVGYDTRFGSDRFARAAAEVLAARGIHVFLSDRPQPTPVISYSVIDRKAGGGIVMTASHNPGMDNGFKVKSDAGSSATQEMVEEIEAVIDRLEATPSLSIARVPFEEARVKGLIEVFDATPVYDKHIAEIIDLQRLRDAGVTVVADAMFGTGMGYFSRLLSGGATQVLSIRDHVNPAFPGIAPEPIRPHIDLLSETIREVGGNIGLATDGDSDRIGAVTEDGTFVNQHQVFGLLLLYLTETRGWRGPAVRSVTMTGMGDAYLQKLGEEMIETPVGFKYIGGEMVDRDAILGGEESGGFGFRGHIPERDAIVAGLFLVDLMVTLGRPMSGVLDHMRETFGDWHYLRVDVPLDRNRSVADQRNAIFKRVEEVHPASIDGSRVVDVGRKDGFKFYLEDGSWLLIRPSGTEPLVRVYTETTSQDRVPRILQQGREIAGI